MFQQSMGEINRAVKCGDLLPLIVQLLLERCGPCELLVQPLPQFIELIFDNGENIGRCH